MPTEPELQRVCDESARGVYFIAGTMALLGLGLGGAMVLDAVLLAGLGFWLQRSRSKVPAALILLVGTVNSILALMHLAGFTSAFRASPIAAAIFVWLGARALLAIKRATQTPPAQGGNAAQRADDADKVRAG